MGEVSLGLRYRLALDRGAQLVDVDRRGLTRAGEHGHRDRRSYRRRRPEGGHDRTVDERVAGSDRGPDLALGQTAHRRQVGGRGGPGSGRGEIKVSDRLVEERRRVRCEAGLPQASSAREELKARRNGRRVGHHGPQGRVELASENRFGGVYIGLLDEGCHSVRAARCGLLVGDLIVGHERRRQPGRDVDDGTGRDIAG